MRALATAMATRHQDAGFNTYAELVELGLGKSRAAEVRRTMMSVDLSFFKSETSQRLRKEGRMQERARNILAILRSRNVPLSADEAQRILECGDLAQLDRWFDRSLSATSAADVFAED